MKENDEKMNKYPTPQRVGREGISDGQRKVKQERKK